MLQACLNGGRSGAPASPGALARAARSAVAAGAAELHVHPRDDTGAETLAPGPVSNVLDAIRAAVPGTPVGIGTGAWIAPGGRARHADIAAWTTRPDYISLNVNEDDAGEVAALVAGQSIAIEAGIWTREDVPRFRSQIDPARCCRILVEIRDMAGPEAIAEADAILADLRTLGTDLPILLHGSGESAWPMIRHAAALGLDARAGLEDMATLPDGTTALGNAAITAAAAGILAQ